MPIHFGTDGWRAVISDTFTFANLRMVAQAIADALIADIKKTAPLKQHNGAPTVVVGFDTRFLSDRFAIDVARVLAANGLQVLLAQSDCPTPAISYAVVDQHALAGVMITASHNPPRYNGIKLKASYGGSVSKEQSHRVEVYLSDNETQGRGPNLMDYEMAQERGLIQRFDPIPRYRAHLEELIDFELLKAHTHPVVVDAMFGSGRRVLANLLRECGWQVTEIRADMNPGFGGIHPEPIDRYLGDLRTALAAAPGAFGLATDGDADRIGAMDEDGAFVDPHKIMALALGHLVGRGESGSVVRTVSTTHMLDRMAADQGLDLLETPVGFNYIADHMIANGVLIGGEESGGISFKGHIPEGDGVLMGLLLAEIVAASGKPLKELVANLLAAYGPVFYERNDLRLKRPVDKAQMSRQLAENAPQDIGGHKLAKVATTDGVKYILDDGSWLLIRPSGTEPVLRVYAEGRSPEILKALMEYGTRIANSNGET